MAHLSAWLELPQPCRVVYLHAETPRVERHLRDQRFVITLVALAAFSSAQGQGARFVDTLPGVDLGLQGLPPEISKHLIEHFNADGLTVRSGHDAIVDPNAYVPSLTIVLEGDFNDIVKQYERFRRGRWHDTTSGDYRLWWRGAPIVVESVRSATKFYCGKREQLMNRGDEQFICGPATPTPAVPTPPPPPITVAPSGPSASNPCGYVSSDGLNSALSRAIAHPAWRTPGQKPNEPCSMAVGFSVALAQELIDIDPGVEKTSQASDAQALIDVINLNPLTRSFPWVVALLDRDIVTCSGILVSDRHVLTAAHCLCSKPPTAAFMGNAVRPYSSSRRGWAKTYALTTTHSFHAEVTNPAYPFCAAYRDTGEIHGSDLAIVDIDTDFALPPPTFVAPLSASDTGARASQAVGFGASDVSVVGGVKLDITLETHLCNSVLAPQTGCRPTLEYVSVNDPDDPADSCKGDSGAGIHALDREGKLIVRGVVSRAIKNGAAEFCGSGGF